MGEWGPILNWPHIPVAVGHIADGRIVTFASTRPTTFPAGTPFTYAAIFDPATGAIQPLNNTKHDMFCAGIATTGDGRILAAGGGATIPTTSFIGMTDLWGQNWVQTGNMAQGRWYNTSITLPDGNILTWWGRGANGVAEYFDAATGLWSNRPNLNALSSADPEDGVEDENALYPNLHVMADGRIFNSGPLKTLRILDLTGSGSVQNAGTRGPDGDRHRKLGFAVMYRTGKILYTGGRDDRYSPSVTNTAVILDVTSGKPVVTPAANMNYARAFHYNVLLPNGEVFTVGGNTSGVKFSDNGGVLTPEIWNPDSNIWRTVAPMAEPRGYHMTAILMRDARVLVGGGGLCGCEADHQNAQIYTPGYLFNADGSLAKRPEIISATSNLKAGMNIALRGSDDIASFSMIRLQGTTHGMNTDQRYLPIPFTKTGPGAYTLQLESNPNVLLPGLYWVYAMNANGVPSIGYTVHVHTSGSWREDASLDVNLARGKSATQSSQWGVGDASRAVDGNQDGNWDAGSMTHTQMEGQPYWQVDLGAVSQISEIRIWNRTDCCVDRLADFHVFVSDEPITLRDVNQVRAQPGVQDLHYVNAPGRATTLAVGRTGRYVRVQLSGVNYLHLAEVEVMGSQSIIAPPPAPPANSAPVVAFTSPAESSQYTAPASISLAATATDADGNLAKVEFYNGATKIGEATAAPFAMTWNSVPAGVYTIIARAVDSQGLTAQATRAFTVNAPAPTTGAPVNLAVGKAATQSSQHNDMAASRAVDGNVVGSYNGFSMSHTGKDVEPWWQVDLGASAYLSEIKLWNRTDCCAERLSNFYVFISDQPFAGTGISGTLSQAGVTALYYAGTAGRTTAFPVNRTGRYVRVQLTAQEHLQLAEVEVWGGGSVTAPANAAPSVAFASPANNAVFTAPASLTLDANAADADNNLARVEFYSGSTKLGEASAPPYRYTWTNVPAGAYVLTAKAVDTMGLSSTSSVNVFVNAPAPVNAAPSIAITSPAQNATFTSPASIAITVNAADADNNLARVEFYNGAVKIGESAAAPYSFTWSNVSAGSYTLMARAVDSLGLMASATVNVVVNAPTPANRAPSIQLLTPAPNAIYTAPASIAISASATDPDNNLARVEYYAGAAKIGESSAAPFQFTWTNAPAGTHVILAKAVDTAGLSATASATIVVNPAAAGLPTVSIVWPANNSVYTAPADITIGANATMPGGAIQSVEFFRGTALVARINAAPYNFIWKNVSAGVYTLTAKANSTTGQTATASIQITVEPPPDVRATITNAGSGMCLEIRDGALVQNACKGDPSQVLRLRPVAGAADHYSILTPGDFCLDTNSLGQDNAPIKQAICTGGISQRFQTMIQPDGSYQIRSAQTGKAWRVLDGSTSTGAAIVQFTWNAVASQKWKIVKLP